MLQNSFSGSVIQAEIISGVQNMDNIILIFPAYRIKGVTVLSDDPFPFLIGVFHIEDNHISSVCTDLICRSIIQIKTFWIISLSSCWMLPCSFPSVSSIRISSSVACSSFSSGLIPIRYSTPLAVTVRSAVAGQTAIIAILRSPARRRDSSSGFSFPDVLAPVLRTEDLHRKAVWSQ